MIAMWSIIFVVAVSTKQYRIHVTINVIYRFFTATSHYTERSDTQQLMDNSLV